MAARVKREARPKAIDVFISHASCDEWVAKQIGRRIEEFGIQTFLSETDIKLGNEDFEERLREALEQCSELVVLLTRRRWTGVTYGRKLGQYGVHASECPVSCIE